MLVLSRKPCEKIVIKHGGEELVIEILKLKPSSVKLGFIGSERFQIKRQELETNVRD